jgi:hypothetical protein
MFEITAICFYSSFSVQSSTSFQIMSFTCGLDKWEIPKFNADSSTSIQTMIMVSINVHCLNLCNKKEVSCGIRGVHNGPTATYWCSGIWLRHKKKTT